MKTYDTGEFLDNVNEYPFKQTKSKGFWFDRDSQNKFALELAMSLRVEYFDTNQEAIDEAYAFVNTFFNTMQNQIKNNRR